MLVVEVVVAVVVKVLVKVVLKVVVTVVGSNIHGSSTSIVLVLLLVVKFSPIFKIKYCSQVVNNDLSQLYFTFCIVSYTCDRC